MEKNLILKYNYSLKGINMYSDNTLTNVWSDFEDSLKITSEKKFNNGENDNTVSFNCDCEKGQDSLQNIININNVLLCSECGLVFEDRIISDEAEWRSFQTDEGFKDGGNRCGQAFNPLAPVHSMSGFMSGNSSMSKRIFWLSLPYEEKVLFDLKKKLNSLVILNNLPENLVNSTLLCYKEFKELNLKDETTKKKSFRKKNKDGILAVCFYYVAKSSNNLNITSDYICKVFDINTKIFSKYCKIYNELMKNNCDNEVVDSYKLVERYAVELKLPFNIQKLCKKIISAINDINLLANVCPQAIIASVIYFINTQMSLGINKKSISFICNIGQNTITKVYKIIEENKDTLFNIIKEKNKNP